VNSSFGAELGKYRKDGLIAGSIGKVIIFPLDWSHRERDERRSSNIDVQSEQTQRAETSDRPGY
jgi:hypothetical protein